jgi:hypothetical protein
MVGAMSRVLVFTYKDGLLARLAHDLQIDCGKFDVERKGDEIVGKFALASLRVDGAVQHGRVAHGVLSDGDRRKILETMTTDVLELRRFPDATVKGTIRTAGGGFTIDGTLELHGRSAPLAPIAVTKRGDLWVAEVTIVPSRWGIAPYRALAGALKLQDRVTVRVELDADRGAEGDARWARG